MPHPRNPYLLTIHEAALYLEVRETAVRYLIERGDLFVHRYGARVFVHVDDVRRVRDRWENQPAQGPAMRILKMLGHRLKVVYWWHNGHEHTDRPEPAPPQPESPTDGGKTDAREHAEPPPDRT